MEDREKRILHGEKASGEEPFIIGQDILGFTINDFWRYQFSNLWNMTDNLSEFLVARALGISDPTNRDYWALYDIKYKGFRIEVKATSDFHCWNKPGYKPKASRFSIDKAYSTYKDKNSELRRQNDIYVFCHIKGNDFESSYPLDLANWEFFVIPTKVINERFRNQKTVSLNRIKMLAAPTDFYEIRSKINRAIEQIQG